MQITCDGMSELKIASAFNLYWVMRLTILGLVGIYLSSEIYIMVMVSTCK